MKTSDPRDLTQYVILKHWQYWLYAGLFVLEGALLGFSIGTWP